MKTSLDAQRIDPLLSRLAAANADFARRHPGDRPGRQPVHTVYGGAHLFAHDTARKLGAVALRALDEYAPNADAFARALGLPGDDDDATARHLAVFERVREKLAREPVEDLRADFEDGYGHRSADEEDGHARSVARALARGMREASLPPFVGIRIKSLSTETTARALRTLDLTLTALATETGGAVPPRFVVTLPKVVIAAQVEALCDALDALEAGLSIAPGAVGVELMVETPQSLSVHRGESALRAFVDAARGRCVAAHFGAYDYTAACGVAATDQSLSHPWCDLARHAMITSLAGTGVRLSDGATTTLPIAPHKTPSNDRERDENRDAVHRAWAIARNDVTRALSQGIYQGWDLHPAQLVARYAAVYDFFLRGIEASGRRLRHFVAQAARATQAGGGFDDAATGQALVNFFLRAVDAGALTEAEASTHAGVSLEALRTRSFAVIAGAAR